MSICTQGTLGWRSKLRQDLEERPQGDVICSFLSDRVERNRIEFHTHIGRNLSANEMIHEYGSDWSFADVRGIPRALRKVPRRPETTNHSHIATWLQRAASGDLF